jgi:hypothetical protein
MPDMTPLEAAEKLEDIAVVSDLKAVDGKRSGVVKIGRVDAEDLRIAASYLRKIAAGEYKPVVHAHWNYTSRPNEDCMGGSHGVIECSHCKEDYGVEYDYCPSCGALMDGKDSDSVAKQA